jgi:hypothetical protein
MKPVRKSTTKTHTMDDAHKYMKKIANGVVAALGAALLLSAGARAQTNGFVVIPDSYSVQKPWNIPVADRFTASNGVYTCWVFGTDQPFKQGSGTGPRTEMRWETWPNQAVANQFAFDEMFSAGTSHTCVHQIKSDNKGDGSGGEAIYLQVNEAGTLRQSTGADFVSGIAGTWYHINSIYDPATGTGGLYYNGSLVYNLTGYTWPNGSWYFKTGVYDNGMPTNAEAWVQIKNVVHWVQQTSPDFSLSASPNSLTITQGAHGTSTITVNPVNGFSGSVSLSASGLPSGVTAGFNPSSTTSTSTLTLTASSTAATGTATVTVTGTSGSLTHTTTISLTVNPAPDFSLSASPSSLTITQGANGASTITVNPLNGFSGSVSLSASGLPSGVTAGFNPSSTTSTSTLTLTASSTAATGTATVTVTGTSGGLTHTTTISLTVNASSGGFTGIYQIQNEASGLVLNNQGSLTNGSAITQWTVTSSSNLDWTFLATSNGYYQINSAKSGLDAVVKSASTANGAGIIQWSLGSSGDDQWKPVQNGDGSYTFYNLHSGLVLEDPGSSTNKTTQMDQWSSTGGANQNWKLLSQ